MHNTSLLKRLVSLLAILAFSIFLLFSTLGGNESRNSASVLEKRNTSMPHISTLKRNTAISESVPARPLPAEPDILAESFLIWIIGDQAPVLGRNASKQMRPASLTKILTSLIAIEELDKDAPVVFSSFAKAAGEKESPVPVGEAFIRNNAIRFAVVESANDAAVALAEAVGRKRGAFSFDDAMSLFVQAANQKARALGMVNSRFQNPTGLDDNGHYTTAEDMFLLVKNAWESHPEIWEFSRANGADIRSLAGATYHIAATNQLLAEFPALFGGKTGLTDQAKGALILLYPVKPNRTAVIIILGSDNRFEDGRKLIHWLEEAFDS